MKKQSCCSSASAIRRAFTCPAPPIEVHLLFTFYHLFIIFFSRLIFTCVYRCKLLFITYSFFFNSQILPRFLDIYRLLLHFPPQTCASISRCIIFRLTGFPFLYPIRRINSRENQLYLFPLFTKHGRALESRPGNQYGIHTVYHHRKTARLSLSISIHRYINRTLCAQLFDKNIHYDLRDYLDVVK